jgi:hypothetical protein
MKKIYTFDNKQLTFCNEFEIKFQDFLEYLKDRNNELYNLLTTNSDFNIKIESFLKNFNPFFQNWLKINYKFNDNLSIDNLETLFNKTRMTEINYSEFFSYYNLYMKIANKNNDLLYFYDSESDSPHIYFSKQF